MKVDYKIDGLEVVIRKDTAEVELMYPRSSPIQFIELGLCCVRAADNIRVSYDFDRDGWKIEQASTFEWDMDDEVCDQDWQEVSFVQAWGREKPKKE